MRPLVKRPVSRPLAAVARAANKAALRVVVGHVRILSGEVLGKAPGALDVARIGRIGHAEHVEQIVALALMKPIVAGLVLVDDHRIAVAGIVLTHLRVDHVKGAIGLRQKPRAAAQQVKQRPVVKALVAVVQRIDALKVRARRPEQSAVWVGVALEHPRRGVLYRVKEPAHEHGPLRRRAYGRLRFYPHRHRAARPPLRRGRRVVRSGRGRYSSRHRPMRSSGRA